MDGIDGGAWRILVAGPPGAGKSTLAVSLGARFGLTVTHLDWSWSSDQQKPQVAAFRRRVVDALGEPGWVLDGGVPGFAKVDLGSGHVVVLLDLPLRVRLPRLIRRSKRVDRGEGVHAPKLVRRLLVLAVSAAHPLSWRRHHRKQSTRLSNGGSLVVLRSAQDVDAFKSDPEPWLTAP